MGDMSVSGGARGSGWWRAWACRRMVRRRGCAGVAQSLVMEGRERLCGLGEGARTCVACCCVMFLLVLEVVCVLPQELPSLALLLLCVLRLLLVWERGSQLLLLGW